MIPETKVQMSKEEPAIEAFSRVSKVLVRVISNICQRHNTTDLVMIV